MSTGISQRKPAWTRRQFLATSAQVAGGVALADLLAACGQGNATASPSAQQHVT